MCEKDDRSSHQNSVKVPHFYCVQRNKFVFRHLLLKKSFKCLLQNIYLMLEHINIMLDVDHINITPYN